MSDMVAEAGSAPVIEPVPGSGAGYQFSRRIVCLSDPEGEATESIRSLRAHLLAGHVRDGRRSLAICAPAVGVGATFVAVNLAVAFAQSGLNTLLIDANLADPGVHDYIRPVQASGGLTRMLTDAEDAATDEVRRDVLPNLSLLYAGDRSRRASEQLASRQFKAVLDDCMRNFDLTIVDAPTERGYADTRRVATTARYAMIVARRDKTFLSQMRELADHLSADRVKLVGTFLTDF